MNIQSYLSVVVAALISTSVFAEDDGKPEQIGSQAVAPQLATFGTCGGQRLSYATDDTSVSTTSTTFVDLSNMVRTITIPGTASTCVAINFSNNVWTGNDELIYVQATRDGVACNPNDVQFEGDSDQDGDGKWARAHAFNFICPNVTPGVHTFKIQWRSFFGGNVVSHERSMVLHHK